MNSKTKAQFIRGRRKQRGRCTSLLLGVAGGEGKLVVGARLGGRVGSVGDGSWGERGKEGERKRWKSAAGK